ncbi:hypothetical protein PRUPE_3G179100 [Prunus persica]|uniref:Uncharacterized protein n=1 Tax=Prunus persica TaxID=3760 RepID=A0A251Q1V4_PRUPE|nr:hypothetical protein PRUPE_3G179100 [Prunus persica]
MTVAITKQLQYVPPTCDMSTCQCYLLSLLIYDHTTTRHFANFFSSQKIVYAQIMLHFFCGRWAIFGEGRGGGERES